MVQPGIFHDRGGFLKRTHFKKQINQNTSKDFILISDRKRCQSFFLKAFFFLFSKNDGKLSLKYAQILLVMCDCWYYCFKESLNRSQVLHFQYVFIWTINYSRSFSKNCNVKVSQRLRKYLSLEGKLWEYDFENWIGFIYLSCIKVKNCKYNKL